MIQIKKIISGGQTGVDQAALNVAIELKIECGGWCPPGKECENGKIPFYLPLIETPVEKSKDAVNVQRSLRTEWNVRDSDVTLVLKPALIGYDKGTEWTIECALKYEKKHKIIDLFENDAPGKIKSWLMKNPVNVLNIAGPSEKNCPGIGLKAYEVLLESIK